MTHKKNGVIVYCPGLHVVDLGQKGALLRQFAASQGWGFQPVEWPAHDEGQAQEGFTFRAAIQAVRNAVAAARASHGRSTRIVLAGSSFGGWAAAWFAATQPGAVQGLLLLNPSFSFVGGTLRQKLKLSSLARMAWVWFAWAQPFRYTILKGDGTAVSHFMPMSFVRDVGMDGYEVASAGQVKCPVLAITARAEKEGFLSAPGTTAEFCRRAGGKLIMDDGLGHSGSGQASAETLAAIKNFLSCCKG